MGRPVKMTPEKIRQLEALMRLKPTLADAAIFLEVDTTTIEKWIQRTHGVAYSVFRDQRMVPTRFNLVRRLLEQADRGNVKAIIVALDKLGGPEWKREFPGMVSAETDGSKITLSYSIPPKEPTET